MSKNQKPNKKVPPPLKAVENPVTGKMETPPEPKPVPETQPQAQAQNSQAEPAIGDDGKKVEQQQPIFIPPSVIAGQVPWKEAQSVVVLVNLGPGKKNQVYLSSQPWEVVAWLSKQLDSHITCHIGPMQEGF